MQSYYSAMLQDQNKNILSRHIIIMRQYSNMIIMHQYSEAHD